MNGRCFNDRLKAREKTTFLSCTFVVVQKKANGLLEFGLPDLQNVEI